MKNADLSGLTDDAMPRRSYEPKEREEENTEPPDQRYHVTIVDRVQQYRFPRTKNRRIRRKWRKREENFRPLMVPVGMKLCLGVNALAPGADINEVRRAERRYLEMSTDLWCMIAGLNPEFAEKCDLFERVLVWDDPDWPGWPVVCDLPMMFDNDPAPDLDMHAEINKALYNP